MHNSLRENTPVSPLRQAGLTITQFNSETLELREIIDANVLRLHSLTAIEQLATATESSGVKLPLQPGQCRGDEPVVLCLRPNEWLLFSDQFDSIKLMEKLRPAINPAETALFDNSDALVTFRLSGPGAPWLLSKLSGLDYMAGLSATGTPERRHCARTRMAHIAVVVHYHQPGNFESSFVWDLIFDRSLAKYLWELLIASANHADDLSAAYG